MGSINFSLTVLLERIMELLALYLILANMNGWGLKESFKWLWRTKQQVLYGNIVVFIGYVVGITILVEVDWETGYLIAHVSNLLIGLYLVRRSDIREGLIASTFLVLLAALIGLPTLFVPLYSTISFALILLGVVLLVHKNYLYTLFDYMFNKKALLNFIFVISFVLFVLPLFADLENGLFLSLMVACFLVANLLWLRVITKSGIKKELAQTVNWIAQSSYDELLLFLQDLSHRHHHMEHIYHFEIYKRKISPELSEAIKNRLGIFEKDQVFRNYACQELKSIVTISIVLQ